jgi:hypothetical protein
VQVINVVGWNQHDARNTLQDQGFFVSVIEQFHNTVANGNVISQSPSAGTSLTPGSTITLIISRGQENVQVANVVGMSQEAARDTLQTQGFIVSAVEQYNNNVAIGNVISQNPSAGTARAPGSNISLTVSKGPAPPPPPAIFNPRPVSSIVTFMNMETGYNIVRGGHVMTLFTVAFDWHVHSGVVTEMGYIMQARSYGFPEGSVTSQGTSLTGGAAWGGSSGLIDGQSYSWQAFLVVNGQRHYSPVQTFTYRAQ